MVKQTAELLNKGHFGTVIVERFSSSQAKNVLLLWEKCPEEYYPFHSDIKWQLASYNTGAHLDGESPPDRQ